MDPKTGEVLAMATAPTFDSTDPALAGPDRGNRALAEIYEPGSTGKIMTVAALTRRRRSTPDTAITCPTASAAAARCSRTTSSHGTWHLTMTGMLAKSSNIGAIKAAEKIGENKLAST